MGDVVIRGGRLSVVGLVGAVLVSVGACSAEGVEEVTFHGKKISEPDAFLRGLESEFRTSMDEGDVEVNVPGDAHCYFQVGDDGAARDTVLCGPVHVERVTEQTWAAYPLSDTGSGDQAQLSAGEVDPGEPSAGVRLVGPDGTVGDPGRQVKEPDAKRATAGEVVDGPFTQYGVDGKEIQDGDPVKIVAPGGAIRVSLRAPYEFANAKTRRQAPVGGTFVFARWQREAQPMPGTELVGEAEGATTASIVVKSGGTEKAIELAREDRSASVAVAVPGDGKDAQVGVRYDGLTQWVDVATGKRVDDPRTGVWYARQRFDGAGRDCPGTRKKVGKAIFEGTFCTLTPSMTAYAPGLGWAQAGKAWLRLRVQLGPGDVAYDVGRSYANDYERVTATMSDVSVDGAGQRGKPVCETELYSKVCTFHVPVDADARPSQFKATLHIRGSDPEDIGAGPVPSTVATTAPVTLNLS